MARNNNDNQETSDQKDRAQEADDLAALDAMLGGAKGAYREIRHSGAPLPRRKRRARGAWIGARGAWIGGRGALAAAAALVAIGFAGLELSEQPEPSPARFSAPSPITTPLSLRPRGTETLRPAARRARLALRFSPPRRPMRPIRPARPTRPAG